MRIAAVAAVDQRHAAIDQRIERQRLSARTELLQHQAHHLAGSLGTLRLVSRRIALMFGDSRLSRRALRLRDRARKTGNQRENGERAQADRQSIPAHELGRAITE